MTTDAKPDVAGLIATLKDYVKAARRSGIFNAGDDTMERAAAALAHLQGERDTYKAACQQAGEDMLVQCRRAEAAEARVAALEHELHALQDGAAPPSDAAKEG